MREKKKFKKFVITLIILFVLVIGLYMFAEWFSKTTGYAVGKEGRLRVARCLSEKGAEFYGSPFCGDCEDQRAVFGSAFKYIEYIDCGSEKELCPNVREIPAWYINKEFHYGLKEIEELEEISACQ